MTAPLFRFDNVTYRYPGRKRAALNSLTLELPARSRIALLGHNGSGKSTLFLHCNGILQPDSGTIYFDGQPLSYRRRDLITLRQRVGVVFQQADDQLFSASVRQDISFGPLNLGLSEDETRKRIDDVAIQCGVADFLDRPTHALSGGEKARVALAGVLAMQPDVLLIDEPTASLDPPARRQVFAIFARLHKQGKSIILATHEVEIARYWADFVVIMEAGRVLAADTSKNIFANEGLIEKLELAVPWYMELADKTVNSKQSAVSSQQ